MGVSVSDVQLAISKVFELTGLMCWIGGGFRMGWWLLSRWLDEKAA
jgi:hypothetical protein